MSCSLKKGFLAIVLSAIALGAVSFQAGSVSLGGEAQLSTGSRMMEVPERNIHEGSVDELRIEQLQGEDESIRPGICSVSCAPCVSSCPPFMGQTQRCLIGQFCP